MIYGLHGIESAK